MAGMSVGDTWLRVVSAGPERSQCITHVERIAPRPGVGVEWPEWLADDVAAHLCAAGVDRPWRHQIEAAESVRAGNHTVIATPAGSGKTLSLWLAPLAGIYDAARVPRSALLSERRRHPSVLYVSPTKALGADQLTVIERLTGLSGPGPGQGPGPALGPESGLAPRPASVFRPVTCDGDASFEVRRYAQASANMVVTNPDYLHYSLLPRHAYWSRFLAGLTWVLVDEAHAYRGVFGAHVALVIRRLRRIAAYYGAHPSLVLASATIANPAGVAGALIGVSPEHVTAITDDAAPHGSRTVVLWRPPAIVDEDDAGLPDGQGGWPTGEAGDGERGVDPKEVGLGAVIRRSATAEASDLLVDLTEAGAQSLVFVRSRFAAEFVADSARARLGGHLAGRIASYRGGYLPEERRELESALRAGVLAGLVTTTALELGIDIPGLDAVVIAGWPGTRASLWQQVGRAGRGGADGLAIWVAGNNPLDSYIVAHPEAVFGLPVEATIFDPANPHILAPHLCAAASELPLTDADGSLFGDRWAGIVRELAEAGVLRKRSTGWYWMPSEPATALTDLRGESGPAVQIIEEETGRLLGTVDAERAELTVHRGAVYVHQGASYVVSAFDPDAAVALVQAKRPAYWTRANSQTAVAVIAEERGDPGDGFAWHFGDVEVRTQVTSYTRMRSGGSDRIDTVALDLPEHAMRTQGCWLTVTSEVLDAADVGPEDLPGALHAAEHAAIGLLPLLATCDRWDLGGLSAASHVDAEGPVVFIHDAVPGGAGFAERAFEAHGTLIRAVRDLLERCPCADGCPSCVQSPKCGNANHVLDKAAAHRLVEVLAAREG
jgi:DEAD/DEAH box helicase domain-containing protein